MLNDESKQECSPSRFAAEYLEDKLRLKVRLSKSETAITYMTKDQSRPPLYYSGILSEDLDAFIIGSSMQTEPLWGIRLTSAGDVLIGSSPNFSPKKVDISMQYIPELIKNRIDYYRAVYSAHSKYCVSKAYSGGNILWRHDGPDRRADA